MLGLRSQGRASQHLRKIWKWNLCACVFMDVCGSMLEIHSVVSGPPVGLNFWTPHANPLMQQLLNSFARQLPPENGGLSLVLFRKNKAILEKKLDCDFSSFKCRGAQSSRHYQSPSPVQHMCKSDVERKRLVSSCVAVFILWLINLFHRFCGCFVCVLGWEWM